MLFRGPTASPNLKANAQPTTHTNQAKAPVNSLSVVHVFVALCDNVHQGIIPVPPNIGDGDKPATNLYWGAGFGVKAFFMKSKDWQLVAEISNPHAPILERCIFKHPSRDVFIVADAYRGREIAQAIWDFLQAASGRPGDVVTEGSKKVQLNSAGSAELVAYVGHDGLMDFKLQDTPLAQNDRLRRAIILSCASKRFFAKDLQRSGATPLLWTTNLMAPEAYTLATALEGWMQHESDEQIRLRAAQAYDKYQHCGIKGANGLFATGW